jgi:hypothetical protein
VQEVRVSLQDKLSTQLDSLISANSVKDWAEAIDKIASFENLYVITTVLEVVTGKEILPGTPNDIYEVIDGLRDWWKQWGGGTGQFWQVDLQADWERFFGGNDT